VTSGPYVGLDPFGPSHADYFFGRTLEAEVLVDLVLARPCVVYYGASGVGKSSILNVGLPRALSERAVVAKLATRRDWHDPKSFKPWLDATLVAAAEASQHLLVLVLDQFEEFFLYADSAHCRALAGSLSELERIRELEVKLLISLRDDSLHRLDGLRRELPRLLDTTLELRHLDKQGVRQAILGPLSAWNRGRMPVVGIDDDFADTLLSQLASDGASAHGRVELAFLQLALQKVWDAEGAVAARHLHTGTLTKQLKGLGGIAALHVNQVLGSMPAEDRALLAKLIDRLVSPAGGKVMLLARDLARRFKLDESKVHELFQPLGAAQGRVLRAVDLPAGRGYEIVHDVLAHPLQRWCAELEAESERLRANQEAEARRKAEKDRKAALRNSRIAAGLFLLAVTAGIAAAVYALRAQRAEAVAQLAKDGLQQRVNELAASNRALDEAKRSALNLAAEKEVEAGKAKAAADAASAARAIAESANARYLAAERIAAEARGKEQTARTEAEAARIEVERTKAREAKSAADEARSAAQRESRYKADLQAVLQAAGQQGQRPLGTLPVELDSRRDRGAHTDLSFGRFAADSFRLAAESDLAYFSSGGLRGNRLYPAGEPIRATDVLMEFPFSNRIVKAQVDGTVVRRILEAGFTRAPIVGVQLSGVVVEVDAMRPVGQRVVGARIGGSALDPSRMYWVATNEFNAAGGDNLPKLSEHASVSDVGLDLRIVMEAVRRGQVEPDLTQPRVTMRSP
jgi:hypothetical protein